MFGFTLAVLLATQCDIGQLPEKPPPVVIEHYDEIMLATPENPHYSIQVWFIRDGRVIAARHLSDEMLFVGSGDGFSLSFHDYWRCDRYITCGKLSIQPTVLMDEGSMEWWAGARVMTDLKEPPAEEDE